nr:TlpA disulfide reductase family protein [Paenibacillus sp. J2TS4]
MVFLVGLAIYQNTGSQGQSQPADLEELPQVGFRAPAFSLTGLDGTAYSLADESKPMVINFWASWCGPCEIEAPDLVKLYEKYEGKIEIYAVNATTFDKEDKAREFAERHGFKFPVLLDDDRNNKVMDQYQVYAFPTTFFVNRDGVIVDKVLGIVEPDELEKKFKRAISSK